MNILKNLSLKTLNRHKGCIGCPFSGPYQLDVKRPGRKRNEKIAEDWCVIRCGKLFPEDYKPFECPCWYLPEFFVIETFWKKLEIYGVK